MNPFPTSRFFVLLFGSFLIAFSSCRSDKNQPFSVGDVNPDSIYFDYKIWAGEGNDNLSVILEYRYEDENGFNLAMEAPCKVEMDGEEIKEDSSQMTGAFFELIRPIDQFTGSHTILFTDLNKKEYKETFLFQPMVLLSAISDTIRRKDVIAEPLVIGFSGLESEDCIRVLLTDTSFVNEGINRVDTVLNGRLLITGADLESLANGPIQLEFAREYERPVKDHTKAGGRLLINYTIKREFFLKD